MAHLDVAYLREVSGGDAEFEQELVGIYLESAPPLLAHLREELEQDDESGAMRAAHTLKGSSRSVGATALAELCAEIELAARAGQLEPAREAMPALEAAFASLEAEASTFLLRPQGV